MADNEVVVVSTPESNVVVAPETHIVFVDDSTPLSVLSTTEESVIAIECKETVVVSSGEQGPPGADGGQGLNGGVFVLDVSPSVAGIVGTKQYDTDVVPADFVLTSCTSDTASVRVRVGCNGGALKYSPSILVSGLAVTLAETATKRWFEGFVDIVLPTGPNTVSITTDDGAETSVDIFVAGAGPDVLACVFGSYPGVQTELKAGDTITGTVSTAVDAVSVVVLSSGASGSQTEWAVLNGQTNVPITIGSGSGSLPVRLKARNALGTLGAEFVSANLTLNQTYPNIATPVVSYPVGKSALGAGDTVTVTAAITSFDTVGYASSVVSIGDPTTYASAKTGTNTYSGYVGSGNNYTITANRVANNATTTATAAIKVATVAPTAAITTSPAGRMASSPAGITYEVRVTANQSLSEAPTLTASKGVWSGAWSYTGGYWRRNLVVADADPRGAAAFSGLVITGLSGLVGNTIISGEAYVVGGFSTRYITFPAFSRVAPLGVNVLDATKVTASIAGGAPLIRYADNTDRQGGFYVADADGTYNATGAYIGLSDSAFASSNTSGTLQSVATEAA